MNKNLKYFLVMFSVFSGASHSAELNWHVGLTSSRNSIAATGLEIDPDATTVLYLAGLSGPSESSLELDSLLNEHLANSADLTNNLIIISNANPDAEPLHFPPEGEAYTENTVSHVLWRWIGTHAPDLIILEQGEDYGFVEAVRNLGIAGFGTLPVIRLSQNNKKPEFLTSILGLERSEASINLDQRVARTPQNMAEQLASVYGYDFSAPVYVPGMSLIGRLRLGHDGPVNDLLAPYLGEKKFEITNASLLAGQLVFAEHYEKTGSRESLQLVLRAANLAFDDEGNPLTVAPFHNEMSDSFFMATPILAKAGKFTGEDKYFDMAARHLYYLQGMLLRENKLYRHSPEADVAWSRGNGFVALGLALTLSDFPREHSSRDLIFGYLAEHLEALLSHQDADGMWHEVIDRPDSFAEITSTAMIGMAIKRGLDNGWLPEETYGPALEKAWRAVKIRTDFDGVFINACTSTGKMTSLDAYLDRLAIFDRDDRAGGMVMNFAIEMANR